MAAIRTHSYDSPVVAVGASLIESRRATPDAIPKLRHAVADYARAVGIDEPQLDGVRLAVSEALSNVVLHAYQDEPGYVHLTARVVGDELWVLVADEGRGHNANPIRPGLGWGLAFITDAADEFVLAERAEGGSEARMVFRLPYPAEAH
jgi:serine/threonine-protein kinase RsbW